MNALVSPVKTKTRGLLWIAVAYLTSATARMSAGAWWTVIGPLSITTLFCSVSIPMMERHLRARGNQLKS